MLTPEAYAQSLSHSQVFHGIELPILVSLVKAGRVLQPAPNSILIEEENRVPGLHVILAGSAVVEKAGKSLTVFGRGAFFGEISLFGVSLGATATIRVGGDPTTVLLITPEALGTWAKLNPEGERQFLRRMCTELCRRLYSTSERLAE